LTRARRARLPARCCQTICALGYDVVAAGDGERILQYQIVEQFVRRADGQLELLTEGSTEPVADTRTHAGIVMVKRYAFTIT
jgi:hypothetical protein